MLIKLFFVTIFISYVACKNVRFDNYALYKVLPKSLAEIKKLRKFQNYGSEYDFWNDAVPSANYINVVSEPKLKHRFERFLNKSGINYIVTLNNIQHVIDKEAKKTYIRNGFSTMQWDAYYTLKEIYAWLDDLAAKYPDTASIIIGGSSYEGNQIKGIKISHGEGKRAIFIESGIHAREWIAPATANFVINELLTSTDAEVMAAARDYDWHIFPTVNPDGYNWSHVGNRLWRKNRRPFGKDIGVDLNRNWDNNWLMTSKAEMSSSNTSSDIFAGDKPFSEIETRSLSTYLKNISDKIDLYLSFHSFSQLLLLPFGNTTEPLANYYDALNIGRRAMGALSVRYGTQYISGNVAEVIYYATGISIDWVKEYLKIPLCYSYELRDQGTYGHLLPSDQILPTGQETMDSLMEMIYQAKRFGYMKVTGGESTSIGAKLLSWAKNLFGKN